jgi:hypothetical protein
VTSTEKIPPPTTTPTSESKVPVTFPVVILEGMTTSDGRYIAPGALSHRALPLPILAQTQNPVGGSGHDGAYVVGQLETLERVDGTTVTSRETGKPFPEGSFVWRGTGWINPGLQGGNLVTGSFNTETNKWEGGVLSGNSADLYEVEAEFKEQAPPDGLDGQPPTETDTPDITVTKGKIAATTLCPVPAFADAYVVVDGQDMINPENRAPSTDTAIAASAWRAQELGDESCLPCAGVQPEEAITAASTPTSIHRPTAWFKNPELTHATPLTIEDDGHVYGHLAAWGTCHTGFANQCIQPPHSAQDYAYFHVGVVRTMDDDQKVQTMPVGHITMGEGGHASMGLSAEEAAAHYDNTNTVVADVTAGEDQFGIWVNGAVRRTATPEQIEALHASPLSGDWRSINGKLELVAALAVNTPGFPIPRARVASGAPLALTAAGVVPVADPAVAIKDLQERMVRAEQGIDALKAAQDGEDPKEDTTNTEGDAPKKGKTPPPPAKGKTVEKQFAEMFADIDAYRERIAREALELRALAAAAELDGTVREVDEWIKENLHAQGVTLEDGEFAKKSKNWVDQEGGLPKYIKRIAKHLQEKGMDESRAIATAVNVAKKSCSSGDTNWPGKQQVNPGSRAEACAAVASWEKKKAASHTH